METTLQTFSQKSGWEEDDIIEGVDALSIQRTSYFTQVPSPQLEAFLPVVLITDHEGIEKQMFIAFEGTVKYRPINGAYGNFIPSADGQQ